MRIYVLLIVSMAAGCRALDEGEKPVDGDSSSETTVESGDTPPDSTDDSETSETDSPETDDSVDSPPVDSETGGGETGDSDSNEIDTGTSGVPYQAVSNLGNYGCAIRADGLVGCWYTDYEYTFSDGPTTPLASIDVGTYPCAIQADGYPDCWGEDAWGPADMVQEVPAIPFEKVEAGTDFACGLDAAGAITCWGYIDETLEGTYIDLCASGTMGCGLRDDGTITCIDSNYGAGSSTDGEEMNDAVVGMEGGYTSLGCEYDMVCAIAPSGKVDCWGELERPGSPPDGIVAVQVVVGYDAACALLTDQTVSCWGSGGIAVGYDDGAGTAFGAPPSGTFTQISAAGPSACGVETDGAILCWGIGNPERPLD